jgi:hypothetical protein
MLSLNDVRGRRPDASIDVRTTPWREQVVTRSGKIDGLAVAGLRARAFHAPADAAGDGYTGENVLQPCEDRAATICPPRCAAGQSAVISCLLGFRSGNAAQGSRRSYSLIRRNAAAGAAPARFGTAPRTPSGAYGVGAPSGRTVSRPRRRSAAPLLTTKG